jgi:hypothetical protein
MRLKKISLFLNNCGIKKGILAGINERIQTRAGQNWSQNASYHTSQKEFFTKQQLD